MRKRRGPAEGPDPPEFGMNAESREERDAKWVFKSDTRNKGPKRKREQTKVTNLKSNSTRALVLLLHVLTHLPIRGLSTGMWAIFREKEHKI